MSEIERFRIRFYSGSNLYTANTGERPLVCVVGTIEYATFSFLASELCTITDMRITTTSENEISYCGVRIFQGSEESQMVFGR